MPLIIFIFYLLFGFSGSENIYECKDGSISLTSEAPLELIKAKSAMMKGVIRAKDQQFAFSVANQSFEGFNSPLQREHFNENYMESKIYPKCSFSGKIIEPVDFTKNGKYNVRAKGILNVHGVAQERIIPAEIIINGSSIKVNSRFSVLLADHNITIPKIVHQKIAEEIALDVNATLNLK